MGGRASVLADLNRKAMAKIQVEKFEVVLGVTRLFEELGKLEQVVRLAAAWFVAHLSYD